MFLSLGIFLVLGTGALFSQKAPAKDGGLGKLFKDFDNWYVDTDGQLTVKMFMTSEGWTSLNTLTVPQDPSLYPNEYAPFGSFDPWYYFTIEYRFKPLRFMTLIFSANIMPETQNKVYSYTIYTFGEAQPTIGFKNSYQDYQAEASFDIGPGDLTFSARYYNRTDYNMQVSWTNGASTFNRYAGTVRGFGWPYDPNYNYAEQDVRANRQEFRYQKLVMNLKSQKALKIDPAITLTGQYLEVVMPNATNRNYDAWTWNNTGDNAYGRTMASYIQSKLILSVDGKITFRPVEQLLTFTLGGTITPLFPIEYASYPTLDDPGHPYLNIIWTRTAYLNIDLRLSPRVLWSSGFTYTSRENNWTYEYTTQRWLEDRESPGWISRYDASKREIWSAQLFTGFQYK